MSARASRSFEPMPFWRVIAVATALETALVAAAFGALMLASRLNGWLDALTNFAPLAAAVAVASAVLAVIGLPKGAQRTLVLGLAGFGLLAAAIRMAPELARRLPHSAAPSLQPLKVVTFNVWDENINVPMTVHTILDADADVVALQETNTFFRVTKAELEQRYPYVAECKPSWQCGLTLLSKRPILETGAVVPPSPEPDGDLAFLWMRTTGPDGRPVTFATTHLTWPIPPGPEAEQRRKLEGYMKPLTGQDPILVGDFNLTPWTDAMGALDHGLKPMVRRTHALFTWPANIPRTEKPSPLPLLPIDQLYAGPGWVDAKVKRLPRAGSDHYGVYAELTR